MSSFTPQLYASYDVAHENSSPSPSSSMTPLASMKQDEQSSRMRCHKGNKPSLPQTKYCPLCPAKFTRTTHLNRHLRTHSNERLHRCETCLSEFTRSDLLTRHKRSCGDLLNQNKSRRKSCQACAESKVKCDLQQPCSKCSSRGRECVFINDPEASRLKKAAAAARKLANSYSSKPVTRDASPTSPTSPLSPSPSHHVPTSSSSKEPTDTPMTDVSPATGSPAFDLSSALRPALDSADSAACTTCSSSSMSPRSDIFDFPGDLSLAFGPQLDAFGDSLSKALPPDILDPFPEQSLSSQGISPVALGNFFWNDAHPQSAESAPLSSLPMDMIDAEPFFASSGAEAYPHCQPSTSTSSTPIISFPAPNHAQRRTSFSNTSSSDSSAPESPEAELQHYLYLFFTAFSHHLSIVHSPTWTAEGKPPVLIRAMQACGALFVKTRVASSFVSNTLVTTREVLIQEVAKSPADSEHQGYLILACLLLQVIGLFHQPTDQRASSNIYHGMVVMMIRRCGLISKCGNWTPPSLSDPAAIEAAWREWGIQESIKRTLLLAYLHDSCHCVFFSLPPSFFDTEVDLCLPAEDGLWNASSASEWLDLLQMPSEYGSTSSRLTGYRMQRAIATLEDKRVSSIALAISPFAHFVLIHSILRTIYNLGLEMPTTSRPQSPRPGGSPSAQSPPGSAEGGRQDAQTLALQAVLQKWLHSWLNAPDTPQPQQHKGVESFMQNAMPYFWLAQVSLLALQQGVAPIGGPKSCTAEVRHHVLKQWLHHIRDFLHSGEQPPASLWDDLMKMTAMDVDTDSGHHPEGLLSPFFEL